MEEGGMRNMGGGSSSRMARVGGLRGTGYLPGGGSVRAETAQVSLLPRSLSEAQHMHE